MVFKKISLEDKEPIFSLSLDEEIAALCLNPTDKTVLAYGNHFRSSHGL